MAAKKKWSKGKVKDKAQNSIMLDKNQYDKLFKEINGSLARRALIELEEKGIIKEVLTSHTQKIYTRALETEAE